nr:MAG TPA: hypothetical protein [Caudoviricetes sp.]
MIQIFNHLILSYKNRIHVHLYYNIKSRIFQLPFTCSLLSPKEIFVEGILYKNVPAKQPL